MSGLLLHTQTASQVEALLKNLPHAVLIIGLEGSGKDTLAKHIASEITLTKIDKLESQPLYIPINKPEAKHEIPIETVRQAIKNLSLRAERIRVVHINQAHLLNQESQNTLLKIIEEPPKNTFFILAVPSKSSVLPTIISRTRTLKILPVSISHAHNYFGKKYNAKKIDSAWSLSRGHAGMMSALLSDNENHPLKSAVDSAKSFLKMTKYERLIYVDKLSSDKQQFALFLDALNRVLSALLDLSIRNDNNSQIRKLIVCRQITSKAQDSLSINTSVRLISLELCLKMPV